MTELVSCFHCGFTDISDNMYQRDGNFTEDEFYCDECAQEIKTCSFCNTEYHESNITEGHNNYACQNCIEELDLIICSECEDLVERDNTELWQNEPVCTDCQNDIKNNLTILHKYEYTPEVLNFHSMTGEATNTFYGIELEIDRTEEQEYNCYESKEDHALEIHDQANGTDLTEYEKYLYIKKDGSIKHGMELVTHPCTYSYHIQNMGWKYILDECDTQGYSSHDIGTCGMHIHISRSAFGTRPGEEEMNIAKLLLFFEINWNNIVKFSRRSQQSITDYCNRYGLKEGEKPRELLEKAKQSGRYFAVNLKNEKTVEIRIFRGTLKLETFTACLQFTHLITELVSNLKVQQVLDLTWTDLINIATEKGYNEFIDYSNSKNLK